MGDDHVTTRKAPVEQFKPKAKELDQPFVFQEPVKHEPPSAHRKFNITGMVWLLKLAIFMGALTVIYSATSSVTRGFESFMAEAGSTAGKGMGASFGWAVGKDMAYQWSLRMGISKPPVEDSHFSWWPQASWDNGVTAARLALQAYNR